LALNNLKPAKGATGSRKRVGRGPGSGMGKTSTRGEKGHKSRSGYRHRIGFEGGQMPLHRRIPKRGFSNARFKKEFAYVNLGTLEAFEAGSIVTPEVLLEKGMIKKLLDGVKVLAKGSLTKALTVQVHRFSAQAQEKIVSLGGKAEVLVKS
jgi:large subunit ribosomal protein L15